MEQFWRIKIAPTLDNMPFDETTLIASSQEPFLYNSVTKKGLFAKDQVKHV